MYKFYLRDANCSYIGMTTRHLATTVHENLLSTTTKTSTTEHVKLCDNCRKNSSVNSLNIIRKCDTEYAAPINSPLRVVVRSRTPFGLGRNGCWPSRGSQLPRALPFIFSLCCPLNDRSRAAHSFFKIGRLFSYFFLLPFSCPSSSPHSSPSLDKR